MSSRRPMKKRGVKEGSYHEHPEFSLCAWVPRDICKEPTSRSCRYSSAQGPELLQTALRLVWVLPTDAPEQPQRKAAALRCLQELWCYLRTTVWLRMEGGKKKILNVPVQEWALCMWQAAKGSAERGNASHLGCWFAPAKAGLDPWALEKIQQDGLSFWREKSERCTRSPKSLQCAWTYHLSSYSRMCKSDVFNSMRVISKPLTLTTA